MGAAEVPGHLLGGRHRPEPLARILRELMSHSQQLGRLCSSYRRGSSGTYREGRFEPWGVVCVCVECVCGVLVCVCCESVTLCVRPLRFLAQRCLLLFLKSHLCPVNARVGAG